MEEIKLIFNVITIVLLIVVIFRVRKAKLAQLETQKKYEEHKQWLTGFKDAIIAGKE